MWDETNELWVVTRYDDIVDIEKNKHVFINSDKDKGGYRPNIPADRSIIGTDDPLHVARRNLVSRRFTPRAVSQWDDEVRDTVDALLDPVLERGRGEIVPNSPLPPRPDDRPPARLPGRDVAEAPALVRDHDRARRWPALPRGGGIISAMEFAGACAELYETKKSEIADGCPMDDVMTKWVTVESETGGEVGGEAFGLDQIISDCLLLLDGGAETTRTVIARTLLELADRPDQWQLLKDGADIEVATEEFIRWVTPVHNFCRAATEDVELHGRTIRKGQQVLLAYGAANRDPAHFDNPETFDLTRTPNHHISFGFGTHFCLGASLARLEIRTFFDRLRQRVDHLERLTDEPHIEMPNAFVFGLKESHVAFT